MEQIIYKPIGLLNRRYHILLGALLALFRHTEEYLTEAIRQQEENDFDSFTSLHYDCPFTCKYLVNAVLAALPFANNICHDFYLVKNLYEKFLEVGEHPRVRKKVVVKLKRLFRIIEGITTILHRLRYTLQISHELGAVESLFPLMRQYRRAINCLTTFSLAQARHKYEAFFAQNWVTIDDDDR